MTSGNVLHGVVTTQIGLSQKINRKKKKEEKQRINRAGTIKYIGC